MRKPHLCSPGQSHAEQAAFRRLLAARAAECGNAALAAREFGVGLTIVWKAKKEQRRRLP